MAVPASHLESSRRISLDEAGDFLWRSKQCRSTPKAITSACPLTQNVSMLRSNRYKGSSNGQQSPADRAVHVFAAAASCCSRSNDAKVPCWGAPMDEMMCP
jgi:hypothetical protein